MLQISALENSYLNRFANSAQKQVLRAPFNIRCHGYPLWQFMRFVDGINLFNSARRHTVGTGGQTAIVTCA